MECANTEALARCFGNRKLAGKNTCGMIAEGQVRLQAQHLEMMHMELQFVPFSSSKVLLGCMSTSDLYGSTFRFAPAEMAMSS